MNINKKSTVMSMIFVCLLGLSAAINILYITGIAHEILFRICASAALLFNGVILFNISRYRNKAKQAPPIEEISNLFRFSAITICVIWNVTYIITIFIR